jgi:hypothetical protein
MGIWDMKTSPYFERTLFYDPSPATDDFFERRVKALFVDESSESWIETFSQSLSKDQKMVDLTATRPYKEDHSWTQFSSDSDTSDSEYVREPPPAPDRHKHRSKIPPPYFEGQGLILQKIPDKPSQPTLRRFIRVSTF